jgi:hypothetical protein
MRQPSHRATKGQLADFVKAVAHIHAYMIFIIALSFPSRRGTPTGSSVRLRASRDLVSRPAAALPAVAEHMRPPAGPSTILCSSLGKERKKLAKVLKSHRKVLEKRLSALTRAEADAPVLSELLSEIRLLSTRLEDQRSASIFRMDDSDSSDSSDDDEECLTRSTAALCSARRSAGTAAATALDSTLQSPHAPGSLTTAVAAAPAAAGAPAGEDVASRMVVSTLAGQIELALPSPPEGWAWDEEEFRAAKFEGASGRVMVCTGSK